MSKQEAITAYYELGHLNQLGIIADGEEYREAMLNLLDKIIAMLERGESV